MLAAGDGIDALALCERYQVDVILLDLMMPRLNGLDFPRPTAPASGAGRGQHLPHVRPAHPRWQRQLRGRGGGFIKPFDLDELIDTLHDAVPPRREAPGAGAPGGVPGGRACRPARPAHALAHRQRADYRSAAITALLNRACRGRSRVHPLTRVRLVNRTQATSCAGSAQTIVPVAPRCP